MAVRRNPKEIDLSVISEEQKPWRKSESYPSNFHLIITEISEPARTSLPQSLTFHRVILLGQRRVVHNVVHQDLEPEVTVSTAAKRNAIFSRKYQIFRYI